MREERQTFCRAFPSYSFSNAPFSEEPQVGKRPVLGHQRSMQGSRETAMGSPLAPAPTILRGMERGAAAAMANDSGDDCRH
jgi:hypothetical protein